MPSKTLYFGDVPVRSGAGLSGQLFRLLEGAPEGGLWVVETGPVASEMGQRLEGVPYFHHPPGKVEGRLQTTRLRQLAETWLALLMAQHSGQIKSALQGSKVDCILTAARGLGFLGAASYARKRGLPLHLLVDEDWPDTTPMSPGLRPWCHRMFGEIYQQATSRLCGSPAVEAWCREKCNITGTVLYPCRSMAAPAHDEPPVKTGVSGRSFTIGYAGPLEGGGCSEVLRSVASAILPLHGRLNIYGRADAREASQAGLDQRNVTLKGDSSLEDLITLLRQETDVLVLPGSFSDKDADKVRFHFPGILADLTAAALPLVIVAPEYSPAIRWARENAGSAMGIVQPERSVIGQALQRLASDAPLRSSMGRNAARTGARMFSASQVRGQFQESLRQPMPSPPPASLRKPGRSSE